MKRHRPQGNYRKKRVAFDALIAFDDQLKTAIIEDLPRMSLIEMIVFFYEQGKKLTIILRKIDVELQNSQFNAFFNLWIAADTWQNPFNYESFTWGLRKVIKAICDALDIIDYKYPLKTVKSGFSSN
jgi:hypothetical protein